MTREADADPVAELRRAFDAVFTRAPEPPDSAEADALAVRVGTRPMAVRTTEIAGLFRGARVTPVPSPRPELLGVATFHGVVAPVYDLASLLGLDAAASAPAWQLLLHAPEPVALAFDSFDGQFRVRDGAFPVPPGGSPGAPRTLVDSGGLQREVVEVGALLDQIRRLARPRDEES